MMHLLKQVSQDILSMPARVDKPALLKQLFELGSLYSGTNFIIHEKL